MKLLLKILMWTITTIFTLVIILVIAVAIFMRQPQFGSIPQGEKLSRIKNEANYRDDAFQNVHVTPQLADGYSYWDITYRGLFNASDRRRPIDTIPSVKSDLLNLPPDQDVLVWFGHSSYFIQIDGKRILVDPVFSGHASPMAGTVISFAGTDIYTVDELPDIDYLFISHDHYDHLDYETILKLKPKTKRVLCGLGVGSHFEAWGYEPSIITEKNWGDSLALADGFTVHITPARHFSGRGFARNKTLWCSFLLQTPSMKIYMGGDSGYDTHFAEIGNKFGPIDLAFIENGQYDLAWPYIHTLPHETAQAGRDLKAKRIFPVHSSKFALANHAWDEPLIKVSEFNEGSGIPLITPVIGEIVRLKEEEQTFKQWWKGLK
jgi:L-ascorbate metabolism protein UlaG (beta-lactamase superfamily)